MGDSPKEGREIASILPFSILRYLERAVGTAESERARVAAGETKTMAELVERGSWSSVASTLAIAAEGTRLTGDTQIGRRGGEELFRFAEEVGLGDVHRSKGSVEAALDAVIAASSRVSVGRIMTIVDRTASSILVEGHYTGRTTPEALFCDYSAGYWSGIPSLFGAAGYAVELECQARGDERCLTQVSWIAPKTVAVDLESAAARNDSMLFRYEELQRMAADLITAEDVSAVLELVVQRAGHAVLAPKFLLAVQLPDGCGLRVHHLGFRDDGSARRAAAAIIEQRASESTLVIDVASKRHHYGCIAALYPKGTTGTDVDGRLMSAYAAHAAAALEATAAFEQAQRDRDTARALLDLSRRLAGAATVPEVANRLVNALPAVAGGCRGSIYLWDEPTRRLVFEACDEMTDPSVLPGELVVDEIAGAAELLSSLEPVFIDVDVVEGDLRALLEATGVVQTAAVPIVARGDLLGLVSASFEARIDDDEKRLLIERLSAFADQAGTAFDNARLLERTRHQATHDELTGLPNRPMLEDRVEHLLALARREPRRLGLLFVDLDRFKNVNDTLGHHAGDDLIRQVAARLRAELRDSDTLARLGGDEFVVLLPDVADDAMAAAAAERLVTSLAGPFSVGGHEVFITCSVGVAVSPGAGTDYGTLLQRADTAMYEAKASGRNSYAVDAAMTRRPAERRLELESALHSALANGELSVVFQPQVDVVSRRIVGAEALVRWQHPTLGAIGPDVFIPIAEDSGLILDIDRWVRRTALAQLREWRDAGHVDLRVSVNVSTRELRNRVMPVQLAADIIEAGVPPDRVELEITERVVMAENDDLVGILRALRAVGVRLAIDDFGTGSAILGRLQHHPVDTLKIDRSFIREISEPSSSAIVAALVQMGNSLGIDVLAEGVEDEDQLRALVAVRCPLAQGYLFSRPVAAALLSEQLRELSLVEPG